MAVFSCSQGGQDYAASLSKERISRWLVPSLRRLQVILGDHFVAAKM